MNTTTTLPTALDAKARPPAASPSRRVTDAPTRVFHWLFALCFTGAYLSAESELLRALHVTLGYTLAGLLGWRVLYGFVGPRPVRWSTLWNKLTAGHQWLRQFPLGLFKGQITWTGGQNALMAALIAGMVLMVPLVFLTGYATFNEWGGEWLEELHEGVGNGLLMLVLGHLGLLLGLSLLRRKNQALPMLSGRIPGPGPDLVKSNRTWLAVLLIAGVLAYWSWEWQQAPQGLISGRAVSAALQGD